MTMHVYSVVENTNYSYEYFSKREDLYLWLKLHVLSMQNCPCKPMHSCTNFQSTELVSTTSSFHSRIEMYY